MSEFVAFDWEPPIYDTYLAASAVADFVGDMYDVLSAGRTIAMQDTQQRFETETDPYGNPWEPLTDDYLNAKTSSGYPENILVRTEDLKTATTDEAAWDIVGEDLVFNAGMLPSYGIYNQFGADRKRGGQLPQRQFIGLSDEAIAKIDALFELKAELAERIWIHPGGYVRTRNELGQFSGGFWPEF